MAYADPDTVPISKARQRRYDRALKMKEFRIAIANVLMWLMIALVVARLAATL